MGLFILLQWVCQLDLVLSLSLCSICRGSS